MNKSLGLLAAIFITLPAHAFIYLAGAGYAKGERPVASAPLWNNRKVIFKVNPNLSPYSNGTQTAGYTSAQLIASAQAAIDAWAAACRSDLTVSYGGTTSNLYDTNDGFQTISFDNRTTAQGNLFGSETTTLAAAFPATSGRTFFDCDIVINGNATTGVAADPDSLAGKVDLTSMLAHEIGHCLGLDHPVETTGSPTYTSTNPFLTQSTMVQSNFLPLGNTDRRTIDQDDKDGVHCVYERGMPIGGSASCASYHGTNGRGAISGVQTGGPTAAENPEICTTAGEGVSVFPDFSEKSAGCVTSAQASSGSHAEGLFHGFDQLLLFILFWLRERIRRL